MRRKIIGIPEVVYYRGRFRASMVWPKVVRPEGDSGWPAPDERAPQPVKETDRPLRERLLPARTDKLELQPGPAGT